MKALLTAVALLTATPALGTESPAQIYESYCDTVAQLGEALMRHRQAGYDTARSLTTRLSSADRPDSALIIAYLSQLAFERPRAIGPDRQQAAIWLFAEDTRAACLSGSIDRHLGFIEH